MFLVAVKESIDIAQESINKITNNEKFKELREELFRNIVSAIHFKYFHCIVYVIMVFL